MDTKEIVEIRAEAEAHLYLAVAKSDNSVSRREQATAIYYSGKCVSLMDIMEIDDEIKSRITETVKTLFNRSDFESWNANNHLAEAVKLFTRSKELGDHTISAVMEKHKKGLLKLAQVDSYLYKESVFLTKIQDSLAKIS